MQFGPYESFAHISQRSPAKFGAQKHVPFKQLRAYVYVYKGVFLYVYICKGADVHIDSGMNCIYIQRCRRAYRQWHELYIYTKVQTCI